MKHLQQDKIKKARVIACFGQTAIVSAPDINTFTVALKKSLGAVVAGDFIDVHQAESNWIIDKIHPRSHILERPIKFNGREIVSKIFAANLSQALIVCAPKPETSLFHLDMFIAACMHYHIKPIIILNKTDLDLKTALKDTAPYYADQLSLQVISSSTKISGGLDYIKTVLDHQTSIVMGQSGVGKSSLLKAILGEDNIQTSDLTKSHLGAHTTTVSYFYPISSSAALIDTPGIREFALWHLTQDDLLKAMPDILKLSNNCRFRNCKHSKEPNCKVLEAIDNGALPKHRLESFFKLQSELRLCH